MKAGQPGIGHDHRAVCGQARMLVFAALAALHPWFAWGQQFTVPQDGSYYIESRPVYRFRATLSENWTAPTAGSGTLGVYLPVLPSLPGQQSVSTQLGLQGASVASVSTTDRRSALRQLLRLDVSSTTAAPATGIPLRAEYAGTLNARTLKRGKPPEAATDLSSEERAAYLAKSSTLDYDDAGLRAWMTAKGLWRTAAEDATAYAYRVYSHLVTNGIYGGDTSNYEARRPSRVYQTLTTDCGGFSLLFAAMMRANGIPARTLFGRWAISQTRTEDQFHVMAEFFAQGTGWVPVDVSGTIVHKPSDRSAYFGNTDGQHLAFHVDPDLEPAIGLNHGWAQYLLLQWTGSGDFWSGARFDSTWTVVRNRPYSAVATATGSTAALTLSAQVVVDDADVGRWGSSFLAARAGTDWYLHDGASWRLWQGGVLPARWSGTLPATLTIPILSNANTSSGYSGIAVYVGYGVGNVRNDEDMLARNQYSRVHRFD